LTIDERIERLTERHEALAQSVEMLRDTVHETSNAVYALRETVHETSSTVNRLAGLTEKLLGVVESHERRIDGLEGRG
jgi:methyl-accepting chemotaxis protein